MGSRGRLCDPRMSPVFGTAPALASTRSGPVVRVRRDVDLVFGAPTQTSPSVGIGVSLVSASFFGWSFQGGPFLLFLIAGLGLLALPPIVSQARPPTVRRMRQLPECPDGEMPIGEPVRIIGMIEPEGSPDAKPFIAPGSGRPAVYVRTFFRTARLDGTSDIYIQEEIRGVPFLLRRADGATFLIEPSAVRLIDRPVKLGDISRGLRRAWGAPTRGFRRDIMQGTLGPGDVIEVVATIERRVSAAGAAAPGRGVPMVEVLTPAWEGAIWIRRLGPSC
jgi:hypothetical protein